MINQIGRIRNLILIGVISLLGLVGLLDIYVVDKILAPIVYFYIGFGTLLLLYGIFPLYANRRLTKYYLDRTKRNRVAIFGLAFILFLILLASIGPLFTLDPTAVNFEEKNLPPLGFTMEQSIYELETGKFVTVVTQGTRKHPLGTDNKGRDMLAMLISGLDYPFW